MRVDVGVQDKASQLLVKRFLGQKESSINVAASITTEAVVARVVEQNGCVSGRAREVVCSCV